MKLDALLDDGYKDLLKAAHKYELKSYVIVYIHKEKDTKKDQENALAT